jgi:putative intracellular protease/amidase
MEQVQKKRNVAILIYDNVEILDFTGPYEVFITGSNHGQDFHVYTVAEHNHPITALAISA